MDLDGFPGSPDCTVQTNSQTFLHIQVVINLWYSASLDIGSFWLMPKSQCPCIAHETNYINSLRVYVNIGTGTKVHVHTIQ